MNIDNVVVAGSNETGNETTNNNTTNVYTPKFDIVKVASDEIVYAGNTTSYTIEVTNTGDCDLTGIFVEEQAPEGLVYVGYVDRIGSWDNEGNVWTYVGTLAPGESGSFVVIYNTTKSMNIDNVVVAGTDITGNETANNNTTNVYSPKFEIVKVASGDVVYVGNVTSYTIRVTNTGDCDLTGIFVEEKIPDGTIYLRYTNKTGEWSFDGENKWTLVGSLAPGENAEFEIFFNTTKSCNIDNVVVAGSDETGNETAYNNTTNVYSPSLKVEKIALNKTVYSGQKTQFIIRVTNTGDCGLTGVYVIEKSFPGLKYASYIANGKWSFDGVNKWTYKGTLGIGESAEFRVIFDTDKVGNFTNTVEAGSNETGSDEAVNSTEVIKKPVPPVKPDYNGSDMSDLGYDESHGSNGKGVNASDLSDIKAGNPLFALLVVLAILGLVPFGRKRE